MVDLMLQYRRGEQAAYLGSLAEVQDETVRYRPEKAQPLTCSK
jgi:hypothetical protein